MYIYTRRPAVDLAQGRESQDLVVDRLGGKTSALEAAQTV